jgi:DNA-binding NtrC family response regulator
VSLPRISPEIDAAIESFEKAVRTHTVETEISTRQSDVDEAEAELETRRYTLYERIKKHSK